jgi:hypothetical protein
MSTKRERMTDEELAEAYRYARNPMTTSAHDLYAEARRARAEETRLRALVGEMADAIDSAHSAVTDAATEDGDWPRLDECRRQLRAVLTKARKEMA